MGSEVLPLQKKKGDGPCFEGGTKSFVPAIFLFCSPPPHPPPLINDRSLMSLEFVVPYQRIPPSDMLMLGGARWAQVTGEQILRANIDVIVSLLLSEAWGMGEFIQAWIMKYS